MNTESVGNTEFTDMILKILYILKNEEDDSEAFRRVLETGMGFLGNVDAASFWRLEKDGEHYVTGVNYPEEYHDMIIPMQYSLSAKAPEKDVFVANIGDFEEGFPEKVRETFTAEGVIENESISLQARLKPFGNYLGVLCFDKFNSTTPFSQTEKDKMQKLVEAVNSLLELRIKMKEKEDENLYRDHLVASISHDVRTPLTVIMGYIELLQSIMGDNEEMQRFLSIMDEQSNYLLNIISDLITLSKINTGNLEIHPEKLNIRELVSNTTKGMRILANKKGLKLKINIASNVPTAVNIDRTSIQKILINLVSNAIKYTKKGHVSVELYTEEGEYLHISVKDTGIGIADERLKDMFNRYTREKRDKSQEGAGLGLSICRELVGELNGSIWAESEVGEGSVFHVILPLETEGKRPVRGKKNSNSACGLKGTRVLLLEDDIENLHLYELIFKNLEANCFAFTDPKEALMRCRLDGDFQLAVVDLLLTRGDASETIKKLKQSGCVEKIVAITGSTDINLHKKAMENGADTVLLKPFSSKELIQTVYH